MHTGCSVFIVTEARTCINPRVSCVTLFFTSVSTSTLKSSHKPRHAHLRASHFFHMRDATTETHCLLVSDEFSGVSRMNFSYTVQLPKGPHI
jgi:hypothetical protein